MSDRAVEPGLPQRVGRYEIQRVIGRGMMGVVYQAHDSVLRRVVALKTISLAFAVTDKEQRAFARRFLEEGRAAATLAHPGIVIVYDLGRDAESNLLYMALEYLRGKTLDAILAARVPLDWREALRTTARVAEALHHAHQHRIVHRDIKPANIMILGSGEPKIMDFGVAKIESAQLSMAGEVFGSPSYMSPEQAQGETVDARTDIFALGAVLYELVTGQKAFGGTDVPGILARVVYEEPTAVTRLVPGLPENLNRVVSRALAKSKDARYPTAKALAEDIDDLLNTRRPRFAGAAAQHEGPTTIASGSDVPGAGGAPTPAGSDTDPGDAVIPSARPGDALQLPEGKRVSIAVLDGPQEGTVFPMNEPRILLGRAGGGAGAQLELQDPQASRTHAAIELRGGRIVLRDLGSTNGTFVGASRIVEATLGHHSQFQIGRTRLLLVVTDES